MSKRAVYALAWSSSQQAYVLTEAEGPLPRHIALDSPAWFAWLAQVPSFAFSGKSGSFTVRKEIRHGDVYWYAYQRSGEKLAKKYLGTTNGLTIARLEQIAGLMQADQAKGFRRMPHVPRVPHETDSHFAPDEAGGPSGLTPRAPPDQRGDPLIPLLATKLHVPRPRAQLVPRSQLTEHLQTGMQGALTLISAPPGFGKTTLLAQWREASHMPVAWLSLETEDNELVRFFSYLIASLQSLDPGIGKAALGLLQTPQQAALETMLTLLTNDLSASQREDFALVLDDYHLITAESIHHGMVFLLEHAPPQMHLILLTRADPPWPLTRLRACGQLCEVRAAELRFATEEAGHFLHRVMRLALSQEEVALVQSRTEGWIAGLQFAALSLRGRTDVSDYLAAFRGSHRYVLDYLSEEVLARQDASVQSFLLHTSVLDRLSESLCDAVTDQPGSQAMLDALEKANLFVVPLDDERHWYRYHQLFAEVLYSHLQQAESGLVPVLHRRASTWYEQHGVPALAVQHALAAPDVELAARLIEQYGLQVALRGQVHLVLGWLGALPDALVCSRARLCLYHALMLMFTHQVDAAEARVALAEQSALPELSADQARVLLGWAAAIRANLARFSGDLARCVTLSQQVLECVPETEATLRAGAGLGLAQAFLVSGNVTAEVERLVAATAAPLRATGDVFALLTSMTLLARLHVMQARLREAAATYEQVLHLVPGQEVLRHLVGSAGYYFGLGDLLREWNDLDEAERFLAQGMELVRGTLTVDATEVTLGYGALARLFQARGNHGKALALLDAFAQLAQRRHFVPHLVAHGLAVRAQVALAQGSLSAALRWLDGSGMSADDDDPSYPQERAYLTLARVRIAQGRASLGGSCLSEALRLLERLRADAEAKARTGSTLEILILQALALSAHGKGTEALRTFERALMLAEPQGYIRVFLDEGEPMVALLRQAFARAIALDYVTTLLSAFGEQAPAVPSHAFPLVEPLTEREHAVLRLLVAGLSNAAIAQELVITVGTVKRHVNSIYTKLGVTSRTQAVARAHALHLL
jgi:ATP/maltotriose-dependent transcriptional regulator MalT